MLSRLRARLSDRRGALISIFIVALALRLAWIAYAGFAPTLNDDAGRYELLGRSLAEGGGYINPNGTTTMFWPPGYPFIIAGTYLAWPASVLGDHELTAVLVVNALMSAASVLLVYAIARRAFDALTGIIAAALLALFPSMIFFAGVTLTETSFTFLALVWLWLIIESQAREDRRLLILAGAIVGFAALVRGQAALFPLAAVPFWLLATRSSRSTAFRIATTVALALAAIAPWTIRNYVESNSLVLISSNDGVNFYIGHSDGADGRGRKVDELVFRYPELRQPEAEAQISRDGFREGLEYAVDHPRQEIELVFRKLFFLYWRDDEGLKWNDAHGERRVLDDNVRDAFAALSNAYYWLILTFAFAGVALTARRMSPGGVLFLSMLVYWTAAHVAFFADPRFHAPVVPIICIFAAAALSALWRAARRDAAR